METNQNTTDEIEIDLGEIFRELWSKTLIIIFSAMAVALLAILVSRTVITPEYVSTTKLYVLARNDSDTVTSGDLQAGALLTTDYGEIIQSRQVTETVIARLNLTDNSGSMLRHEDLLGKISVSTPSDSRVINISVTDDDPYEAVRYRERRPRRGVRPYPECYGYTDRKRCGKRQYPPRTEQPEHHEKRSDRRTDRRGGGDCRDPHRIHNERHDPDQRGRGAVSGTQHPGKHSPGGRREKIRESQKQKSGKKTGGEETVNQITLKLKPREYQIEEAFRTLRTNLQFCGEDKKVIAFTSCTPNEGKSTVSLQVALSLAESGKKTVTRYLRVNPC